MKIVYNKQQQPKKKFAVCVKGLNFPGQDISERLVEWVELLLVLGADMIFFYKFDVHSNVEKVSRLLFVSSLTHLFHVLNFYSSKNLVSLTPISLPGSYPNTPMLREKFLSENILAKRQNELIPYNDCLYRNLYRYTDSL